MAAVCVCIRSPYSESNDVNRQFLEMSVASAAFDIDEDQRDIEHILHRVGLVNSYPPCVWNVLTVVFQLIVTTRLGKIRSDSTATFAISLPVHDWLNNESIFNPDVNLDVVLQRLTFHSGPVLVHSPQRKTDSAHAFLFLFPFYIFSSLLSLTDRLFNQ